MGAIHETPTPAPAAAASEPPIEPISPGKVYLDGWLNAAHIMGPVHGRDGLWWSLEGHHYNSAGRLAGREASEMWSLQQIVGEHADGHGECTFCDGAKA